MMNKEEELSKIDRMHAYYLEKELGTTNQRLQHYYSGVAAGLQIAYKLVEDELPFEFIRDN